MTLPNKYTAEARQRLLPSVDNDYSFAAKAAEAIGGMGLREGVDALLAGVKNTPNEFVLAGLLRGPAASKDLRGIPVLIAELQPGVQESVRTVALGLLSSVTELFKGHEDELVLSVSESLTDPYDFVRHAGDSLADAIRLKAVEDQVAVLVSKALSPAERQEAQKAFVEIRGTPLPHNPWLP